LEFGPRPATLRLPEGVVLQHAWTDEGVTAAPVTNGGQALHLAVALCILNDTYREATGMGIEVDEVAEIPRAIRAGAAVTRAGTAR
jgi:hypothetical protein